MNNGSARTATPLIQVATFIVNGSYVNVTGPSWNVFTVIHLNIAVCSVVLNGLVTLLFLRAPQLRTPFNIYLLNLIAANFIDRIVVDPGNILEGIYSGWWLGEAYCSVYIFGVNVLGPGVQNSHALIAVNRLWAGAFKHFS